MSRSPTRRGQPGARHGGRPSIVAERVAAGAVLLVADHVGRVLVERAAGVHGHQLHAAADPQHRQPDGVGGVEQRHLPGVAVRPPAGGARVRLLAVPLRVDVRAAGDHQPVEPRDHGVRGAGLRSTGGSSTGTPPAASTASAYGVRQQVGALRATRPSAASSR